MAKNKAETTKAVDLSVVLKDHNPELRQHLIDHIQQPAAAAAPGAAPGAPPGTPPGTPPGAAPGAPAATGVGDVIQIVDTVMKYLPQVDAFIKNLRKRRKG
jgi:hypothetical protein